jgi:hypothetical protein
MLRATLAFWFGFLHSKTLPLLALGFLVWLSPLQSFARIATTFSVRVMLGFEYAGFFFLT